MGTEPTRAGNEPERPDSISDTGLRVLVGSAGQILLRIFNIIALFFTARWMGPEALGSYGLVFAYIGVFSIISGLGIPTAHLKRVSEGRDFGLCNGTFFSIRVVQSLVVLIMVISTYGFQKFILQQGFKTSSMEVTLGILLVSRLIGDIGQSMNFTFSAKRETVKQWMPLVLGYAVEDTLDIVIVLVAPSIILLAWANLANNIVATCGYLFLFRRYPVKKPTFEFFKLYLVFAIPMLLVGVIEQLYESVDRLLIGFWGGASELGLFMGAISMAYIIGIVQVALGGVVFPTMSHNLKIGAIQQVRRLARAVDKILISLYIPILILIWLFRGQIVGWVFGDAYKTAGPVMVLLTAMIMVRSLYVVYSGGMLAKGLTGMIVLIISSSIVLYVIGGFVMYKVFPPEKAGMAIALLKLITESYLLVSYRFWSRSIIPMSDLKRLAPQFISGGVLFFIASIMQAQFPANSIWVTALLGIFALLIYFGFLMFLRAWNFADWQKLFLLFKPSSFKEYIQAEFGNKS